MQSPALRYLIQVILLTTAYLAAATVGLGVCHRAGKRHGGVAGLRDRVGGHVAAGDERLAGGLAGALLANSMNALVALAVSGGVGEPGAWASDLLAKMPHVSLATAAAIATGNTCEALLATWLCRRLLPQE